MRRRTFLNSLALGSAAAGSGLLTPASAATSCSSTRCWCAARTAAVPPASGREASAQSAHPRRSRMGGWRVEIYGTVMYDEEEDIFKMWYIGESKGLLWRTRQPYPLHRVATSSPATTIARGDCMSPSRKS
jgi:hypothetical protein